MDYYLGEKLFSHNFPSGLTAYVLPKIDFNKVFAMYSTHYGSIDSEFIVPSTKEHVKVPEGVAHFLEHKMFDMEYGNVFDRFAELGTSANAFTNYNNTTYLFSATSNFKENLELLLEYVDTPYFTQESVEKEKGIISQELKMYQDDPGWQVYINLLKGLYHKHPVREDIGGNTESIKLIDADLLNKCYDTFYHPSNMVIFVTGAINADEVFKIVAEHEESRIIKPQAQIERLYPKEPENINILDNIINLDVHEPLFYMGFKDVDVGYDGYGLLKKEILTDLALEAVLGRSSLFYEEIYEKGLIDDRFGFSYDGQVGYGHCVMGGETPQPDALYSELYKCFSKAVDDGISTEDYIRIKRRFQGDFIRGFNSPEFIATSFVSYYHRSINVFDYLKALEEIEIDEVNERMTGIFDLDRHSTSTIMPK